MNHLADAELRHLVWLITEELVRREIARIASLN